MIIAIQSAIASVIWLLNIIIRQAD